MRYQNFSLEFFGQGYDMARYRAHLFQDAHGDYHWGLEPQWSSAVDLGIPYADTKEGAIENLAESFQLVED